MSRLLLVAAAFSLVFAGNVPEGAIAVPLVRESGLGYYLAEFYVGTPPQKELLAMDTGSPTYSFLDPRNSVCESDTNPCSTYGTFDNTTSSTSIYERPGFSDDLSDFGLGDFLNDTVTVGGVSSPHMYFGYISSYAFAGQAPSPPRTIAGLALNCFETGPNCTWGGSQLLPQLRNASAIDHLAASFYLGPNNASDTGSEMILGGAYDKAKMAGEPFTLKMVDPFNSASGDHQTNRVNVTALSAVAGGEVVNEIYGDADVGQSLLMDTGNPYWSLPYSIYNPVFATLGNPTQYVPGTSAHSVSCSLRDLDASSNYIAVSFAGTDGQIKVPINALVADFGNGTCGTFILNSTATTLSGGWGAPFLASTYAIFDEQNLEITFAQVNYTTETEYVKLPQAGFGR